jgi:hypothetical protein
MNRIKFLFLAVYLILSQSLFAQADQLYNIRGTVKDDVTQQALIGALVYVVNHENQSTITDENGDFRIEALPLGRHSLQVSYLGYVAYVSNIEIKSGKGISAQHRHERRVEVS